MAAGFRALCGCCSRPVQCLCCSLKFGVLFLSSILFVNACLAFAGEALLVFDLGAAVVANLEGRFLPPGTKLADADNKVHGGLITAGVYALFSSLVGFISVCRRSLRAATVFFLLQLLNAIVAISLLLLTWFMGTISFSTLLANVPGMVLMLYLAVVCNSYRQALKAAASRTGLPGSGSHFAASRLGFDDDAFDDDAALDDAQVAAASAPGSRVVGGGAGGDRYRDTALSLGGDDELTVTARDVELGVSAAGTAGKAGGARKPIPVSSRGGGVAALADGFDDDDDDLDDDGDLGKPSAAPVRGKGRQV